MEMENVQRRRRLRAARPRPRRLSQLFREIADNADGPISIGDLIDAMGDRSFAALLLFFAAINLLPLPPGATLILGAPLILVGAQMAWGSKRVWLPRPVRAKTFTPAQFRTATGWISPRLERLERLIQPRYWPFWRKQGERVVGLLALFLGIVVTLPIPLGNWLPALSIALLSLALTERDGLLFWMGVGIGVLAIVVITLVVGSVAMVLNLIWSHTFARF